LASTIAEAAEIFLLNMPHKPRHHTYDSGAEITQRKTQFKKCTYLTEARKFNYISQFCLFSFSTRQLLDNSLVKTT
jgi:hypothetical protein